MPTEDNHNNNRRRQPLPSAHQSKTKENEILNLLGAMTLQITDVSAKVDKINDKIEDHGQRLTIIETRAAAVLQENNIRRTWASIMILGFMGLSGWAAALWRIITGKP